MVTPRESVPYLGGDEQVFSIDDAVSEDFLQSNTNLGTRKKDIPICTNRNATGNRKNWTGNLVLPPSRCCTVARSRCAGTRPAMTSKQAESVKALAQAAAQHACRACF